MPILPEQYNRMGDGYLPTEPILFIGGGNWLDIATDIRKRLEVNQVDVIEIPEPPKIEDLREKLNRVYYQPQNSQFSLLFLYQIDCWSNIALNKLLKLIEEPPRFLKIFLFSKKSNGILPTIISRVQVCRLTKKINNPDIISVKQLKELTLADALDQAKILVENHKVSAIMNHWIGELSEEDKFDWKIINNITKKIKIAGNQPINQKMFLESVIFSIKIGNQNDY